MYDFAGEFAAWRAALDAAERDGFHVAESGHDGHFMIFLGVDKFARVEYGEGVLQRGLNACLGLLAMEEEQARHG